MTASKFMDIQRAIQPDWFQCISDGDTISGEAGRKRAKKSVDRSLSFLDICLQLQEKSPVSPQDTEAISQELLGLCCIMD